MGNSYQSHDLGPPPQVQPSHRKKDTDRHAGRVPKTSASSYIKGSRRPNSRLAILQATRAADAGNKRAQLGITKLDWVPYLRLDSRKDEVALIQNASKRGYIQRYNRRRYQF